MLAPILLTTAGLIRLVIGKSVIDTKRWIGLRG
jgi:hypothetical protein